jgi:uncharacterized repeat protein (TIGR03837 family)
MTAPDSPLSSHLSSGHARGPALRCDIFCTVIDNFGDIGVCWRLARQLAAEQQWHVRLWVDDLASFARLCPTLDPQRRTQTIAAVEIRHWRQNAGTAVNGAAPAETPRKTPGHAGVGEPDDECPAGEDDACADIVIEAFACALPEPYLLRMAARARTARPPVWINLEYLSAEPWVTACHLQPSPHPRHPALRKTFFFPGLRPGTGGVLRERGLAQARRLWLAAAPARAQLWTSLGVPPPSAQAITVSLFAYENPALHTLMAAWRDGEQAVVCLIPQGRISVEAGRFFGMDTLAAGQRAQAGALTVHAIPFTEQDAYDRLLWACDLNFVRGEDSFVRAQWAERPFVWQIYPQTEAAHQPKLEAALECYAAALDASVRADLTAFWQDWNDGDAATLDWPRFWQHHGALLAHAPRWAAELAALGDLAGNLAEHVGNQLK